MDSSVWLLQETNAALDVRITIKQFDIRTITRHKRRNAHPSRAAAMSANPL